MPESSKLPLAAVMTDLGSVLKKYFDQFLPDHTEISPMSDELTSE